MQRPRVMIVRMRGNAHNIRALHSFYCRQLTKRYLQILNGVCGKIHDYLILSGAAYQLRGVSQARSSKPFHATACEPSNSTNALTIASSDLACTAYRVLTGAIIEPNGRSLRMARGVPPGAILTSVSYEP